MKNWALGMMLTCLVLDSSGQSFLKDQASLARISKKLAKKAFIKTWGDAQRVNRVAALLESYKMTFVAIPSFMLSKEASKYDSSKHIIDYLIPNRRHPLESVLLFRKNPDKSKKATFDGVIECFDGVFYNDDTPCHFDNSEGHEPNTRNYSLKQGFEALSGRNYSFLFSVRHVRNCFWFVENNKVYLLDLEQKKVYDPDEYIKAKCSAKVIRDLAAGVVTRICN